MSTGTTVTWTNAGDLPHNVADVGSFGSDTLKPGAAFSYTFKAAGTYHYVCTIHVNLGMNGTVIVTP